MNTINFFNAHTAYWAMTERKIQQTVMGQNQLVVRNDNAACLQRSYVYGICLYDRYKGKRIDGQLL